MDRSTTIGYILIFVLFVAFFYFNQQNVEDIENAEGQNDTTAVAESTPIEIIDSSEIASEVEKDTFSILPSVPEEIHTLNNELISIDFTSKGGVTKKVTLKDYKRYDSSDLVLFEGDQQRFNYIIPLVYGTSINTSELNFKITESSINSVSYEAALQNGAKVKQHYKLNDNSYKLDYTLSFENVSKILSPNNRYAILDWTSQLQLQEKTISDEAKMTSVYYKFSSDEDVDNLSETKNDEETLKGNLQWISFKQKFFNQTLIHTSKFEDEGVKVSIEDREEDGYVKEAKASLYFPIEQPNVVEDMAIYYGPNHYQTLIKEGIELQQMIPLGWGIFGWVNKLVVIPVFNWLEQYFTSYGVIILLLTLIIKLSLFFPMYKVYKSSAKMRLLKPELDEIKERTGGDMQKAQQEQMKLYKQAGVSPLGGCLPQLIQMPILFAMFRFFPASIELRQEKLWWAEDLSSYDSIYTFPNGFEIPFYGDHISLFTLMMTAVTLLYTITNSQTSGQMVGPMKTVIYIMPIMFLGFFNNYAAALSFYYFLSTCLTIVQNFVIRKFVIDEDKLHKQLQANKKKKVKVKKLGLQKRLEDMAKKRGIDPYSGKPKPAGRKRQ